MCAGIAPYRYETRALSWALEVELVLIGQVTVPCMLWGFGTAVGELQLGEKSLHCPWPVEIVLEVSVRCRGSEARVALELFPRTFWYVGLSFLIGCKA